MAVTAETLATDQIVIVCYPLMAGGKFLINALGLSPDAVFSSASMAQRQLQGQLTELDKLSYLNQKLTQAEATGIWNDLDLNCPDLFGVWTNDWYANYQAYTLSRTNVVIDMLAKAHHKFFYVAHNTIILEKLLYTWPNAKIILFHNCREFCRSRIDPTSPYLEHFDIWHDEYSAASFRFCYTRGAVTNILKWDNELLRSDWSVLQPKIQELYHALELREIDYNDIKLYYNRWSDATQKIKTFLP